MQLPTAAYCAGTDAERVRAVRRSPDTFHTEGVARVSGAQTIRRAELYAVLRVMEAQPNGVIWTGLQSLQGHANYDVAQRLW